MKLPNCKQAYIPVPKLDNYLLADSHPTGRLKAKFFKRLGSARPTARNWSSNYCISLKPHPW
jgi:hypothetical protein